MQVIGEQCQKCGNDYDPMHPCRCCECVREDALDCMRARYGTAAGDEQCECHCHMADEIEAGANDVFAGDP